MPRIPPTHQRHLLAAVKYKDLEKRKRERRTARREDGRATDAKQARMRGRITAVCVKSASPSPTHREQPCGNVVQANPPFAGIPAARSGNINKILRALPDAQMAPSTPKDTIPADVSTSLPETPFIHVVQPNALSFVVQAQGKYFPPGQPAPLRLVISAAGGCRRRDTHSLHLMWTKQPRNTESPLTYKVTVGKRISDDTPRSSREGYDVKDAVEAYADTALSYQVQGLCPNSSYRYSVTAISLSGDSTASTSAVFMTAKAPPSQLQPPHLLANSAVTIQVGWQSPSDNGSLISGYMVHVCRRVQAHPAADNRYVVEAAREIDVGLSLSCQVLGLSPDSTYEFSVRTISSLGVSNPSTCQYSLHLKLPRQRQWHPICWSVTVLMFEWVGGSQ